MKINFSFNIPQFLCQRNDFFSKIWINLFTAMNTWSNQSNGLKIQITGKMIKKDIPNDKESKLDAFHANHDEV